MPVPVLIALIVGAWIVVAAALAFVIGRTAAAGEHERKLDALQHEARLAEAAVRSTDGPAAEGSGVSTRPRS